MSQEVINEGPTYSSMRFQKCVVIFQPVNIFGNLLKSADSEKQIAFSLIVTCHRPHLSDVSYSQVF